MDDSLIEKQNGNFANTVLPAVPSSEVYLEDCVKALKRYADNHFDLAIVDPPYGIGAENHAGNKDNGWTQWAKKDWDKAIPNAEYWEQLFRVSKNQIVWGANYMTEYLPPKMGWIVWDKGQRDFSLADGELAWTSFDKAPKIFRYSAYLDKQSKFHPTQKPIKLYDWIFYKYAKEGMNILDTHLGSGSSRISANRYKLNFIGCEIDKDYFDKQNKRYADFISQQRLF